MAQVEIADMPALSSLLDLVRQGEEVALLDRGLAVAKVVPMPAPTAGARVLGRLAGQFRVPDDFDAPLPDDLLALFEGDPDAVARDRAGRLKGGGT